MPSQPEPTSNFKPLGRLSLRKDCEMTMHPFGPRWLRYWRQEVTATVADEHAGMAARGYRTITARFYLHLN